MRCRCLILIEMLARLFLGRRLGEVLALQSLDRQVGGHLNRAKSVGQHSVLLQGIQRLVERGWQSADVASQAVFVAQVRWINIHGIARMQLAADAIQPNRDQRAKRQIRIAAVVGRFELEVGRFRLSPPERRGDANRALPIV